MTLKFLRISVRVGNNFRKAFFRENSGRLSSEIIWEIITRPAGYLNINLRLLGNVHLLRRQVWGGGRSG